MKVVFKFRAKNVQKDGLLTNRKKNVFALSAMTLLVAKMILLERFRFGQPPFEFVIVSAIIPLAILFGVVGVVGMSIGCTIAHSLNFIGFADVFGAGGSVLLGCSLAYTVVKKTSFPGRFFVANLITTASMAIIMGTSWAYIFNLPLEAGIQAVFASIWIGLNIVGYLLQQTLKRLLVHYQVIAPL